MAKGNGGTRVSNPANMYRGGNASVDMGMSPTQFQSIVNTVAGKDYPAGWSDLDDASRELALMEAGFTGLASDGAEDIMFEDSRDELLGPLADNIVSDAMGYQHDNDISATIVYKDGSERRFDTLSNDFEIRPVGRSSSRGLYDRAYRSMDRKNISYVTYQDSANARYYTNGDDGMKRLKRDTGYEKWTNGRGEKRRDYIQDDWI